MAKNVISVTVHQKGGVSGNIYPSGKSFLVAVSSIRGSGQDVDHTPVGNTYAAVGLMGEAPSPEISEKVYGVINVINPSNASTEALFCAETVAEIVADINS